MCLLFPEAPGNIKAGSLQWLRFRASPIGSASLANSRRSGRLYAKCGRFSARLAFDNETGRMRGKVEAGRMAGKPTLGHFHIFVFL